VSQLDLKKFEHYAFEAAKAETLAESRWRIARSFASGVVITTLVLSVLFSTIFHSSMSDAAYYFVQAIGFFAFAGFFFIDT